MTNDTTPARVVEDAMVERASRAFFDEVERMAAENGAGTGVAFNALQPSEREQIDRLVLAALTAAGMHVAREGEGWQPDPRTVEACAKVADATADRHAAYNADWGAGYTNAGRDTAKNIRALTPPAPTVTL